MRELIKILMNLMPRKLRVQLKSFWHLGYWINVNAPETFNEKIAARKLKEVDGRFVKCADKLAVRDYVEEKIGGEYLIPLLYNGDCITADILQEFGGDFVAKNNHDSGNVFIVKNHEKYEFAQIANKLNESLKFDFGKRTDELWYSQIKPQVIVEKLLINSDGSHPEDYKFHFFNGQNPKIILQVDFDRFSNHCRAFYDMDGNLLPFGIKYPRTQRELPISHSNLSKMMLLCEQLGSDFDYVRVDFYLVDENVYFGELTFAHGGGFEQFEPREYDKILGGYW